QKKSGKRPKHGKKRDAKSCGKKDPGMPQLSHFKEHTKKEAALKQKRVTELLERQQLARQKEIGRFRSLEGLQKDALHRQQNFEQKEMDLKQLAKHALFERESSCKAYCREFRKVIEAADVVLEVLDARDPQGCRCPQVEQAVVQAGVNKKLVLVLNKIDLVSKEIVVKWLKYLRNEFPTVAFKASTQQQSKNLQQSRVPVTQASGDLLSSGACVGADCLMKVLANYCRNQDIRTSISVGVVGFPNVGKSSLINSLKRSRACNIGATPGVTKYVAVLFSREKGTRKADYNPHFPSSSQILQYYGVPDFQDPMEFLAQLARRQGKLKKGGTPDHEKAAKVVLSDWTSGKISYFTHPPETHTLPTHISAEIVAEMSKAFDFEALEQDNEKALASRCLSKVSDAVIQKVFVPLIHVENYGCSISDMPSSLAGISLEESGLTNGTEVEMDEKEGLRYQEQEETKMEEDGDGEFGPMTIELKAKNKTIVEAKAAVPQAPNLQEICALDPLHQGQGLRAASKRRKKQQKRAEKIATKLSATLTAAMNFSFSDD
ncbi:hypothetical protein lerEdw1_005475, partial [Lerista edwardsae]